MISQTRSGKHEIFGNKKYIMEKTGGCLLFYIINF